MEKSGHDILFMSSKDDWRLRHSAAADAELIAGKIGRTAGGRNCGRDGVGLEEGQVGVN